MSNASFPEVSIIMPVFNTGKYLNEAICSVLEQEPTIDCPVPNFEIIVVDDHSTDPLTLEILDNFSRVDSRITVIKNQRAKGAAGARNTGIMFSRGRWIGFLDSDDIFLPHSLVVRWQFILQAPDIEWVGAKFKLLKPQRDVSDKLFFESAKNLIASISRSMAPISIKCIRKPVADLSKDCMIGIMTVLIKRDLLIEKGMFEEKLRRAEDFHLWFKCAFDRDLWMIDCDVAFYRIHSGSLTHGDAPRLLHEDAMINLLLKNPAAAKYRYLLLQRFDLVMQDHCFFYRERKLFAKASHNAWQWIKKRPSNKSAWKELIACFLRVA